LDPAQVTNIHYFGATAFKNGRMVKYVKTKVAAFSPGQKTDLGKVITALLAEGQTNMAAGSAEDVKAGRALFADQFDCGQCHQLHNTDDSATAPDLTGYASREWLISFIGNPKQDKFYGKRNDRMPAFAVENILDSESIALLADWLRGDWPGATQLR
ncbi:MAG TPA: cytochrome c, partial [Candidatus Saccharimonadales bacterium]|nr:cytochrome c [Candidatus Saccharimonadales bacterium]